MKKRTANNLVDAGAFVFVLAITYPIIVHPKEWTVLSATLLDMGLLASITMVAYGIINGVAIRVTERMSQPNKQEQA